MENTNRVLNLGARGGSVFFSGEINDVIIFNKELNQSEVTQLHNALAL
jgi:hypothetical protein